VHVAGARQVAVQAANGVHDVDAFGRAFGGAFCGAAMLREAQRKGGPPPGGDDGIRKLYVVVSR
jgi:hypothetical protein